MSSEPWRLPTGHVRIDAIVQPNETARVVFREVDGRRKTKKILKSRSPMLLSCGKRVMHTKTYLGMNISILALRSDNTIFRVFLALSVTSTEHVAARWTPPTTEDTEGTSDLSMPIMLSFQLH